MALRYFDFDTFFVEVCFLKRIYTGLPKQEIYIGAVGVDGGLALQEPFDQRITEKERLS